MAPAAVNNNYLDGQAYLDCSQETSAKIDLAVQKLLNTIYSETKQTLIDNRQLLNEISEYLLAKETITGEELMAYVHADQARKAEAETAETEE